MILEEARAMVLKENRLKLGLSEEELANKCGLCRTYISLLERGLRKPALKVIFLFMTCYYKAIPIFMQILISLILPKFCF